MIVTVFTLDKQFTEENGIYSGSRTTQAFKSFTMAYRYIRKTIKACKEQGIYYIINTKI
jgi:hypothetical protein